MASWGERLTRINAETTDVKRVVVVVVVDNGIDNSLHDPSVTKEPDVPVTPEPTPSPVVVAAPKPSMKSMFDVVAKRTSITDAQPPAAAVVPASNNVPATEPVFSPDQVANVPDPVANLDRVVSLDPVVNRDAVDSVDEGEIVAVD